MQLLFRFAGRQNIECEKMHYEFAGQSRNFKFKLNLKYASATVVLSTATLAAGGPRRPSESVARKLEITMMP